MALKKFKIFADTSSNFGEISLSDLKEIPEEHTVIMNSRKVLDYTVRDLQTDAFKNNKNMISQYTGSILESIFGKCNLVYSGDRKYKTWIFNFGDRVFTVYTQKDMGTQICVDLTYEEVASGKHDKLLIEFSKKFFDIINGESDI